MESTTPIAVDIQKVRVIFARMRDELSGFMNSREFNMSNAQMFTFLSYTPNALAIASDGIVDEHEYMELERLSMVMNVKMMVNLDLMELLALAPEPSDVMTNEEFNIRAGSEMLFLCKNMAQYESAFLGALKNMLQLDTKPGEPGSIASSFNAMMNHMVHTSKSKHKEREFSKLAEMRNKLGL